MKYKIEFQYKEPGRSRPLDAVQGEEIGSENGQSIPIPNVGDSVALMYGERTKAFKVATRHFSYMGEWCVVNIVVTDIADDEMAARLIE